MHYKDGTPAKLGDIFKHDTGHVGIIIGGQIGSDYCSTHAVTFRDVNAPDWSGPGAGYLGTLRDDAQNVVAHGAVKVVVEQAMQTREMVKIGHVDIGHG